ncbi:MAG: methyltransferase [Elusimicrobia bacterium HGW-Elusimicrobia-4]|nr:MAG: methyltransferase [Elusimicrobia bacterium HGW-Elusimicrobia-4]
MNRLKLHLGCGKRFIPGFTHIDIVDYPHIDHITSVDNLSMFPDNSVDLIYSCHVLEHFKRHDVVRVLKEWNRVLKKDGIIRTAVPDFEKLVEVYLKYHDLKLIIGPLFGRLDYLYNIHYNIFDYQTLSKYLSASGFINIHHYDWRQTEHSNIDDFSQAYVPHMDKANGILISLNVEAVKG